MYRKIWLIWAILLLSAIAANAQGSK